MDKQFQFSGLSSISDVQYIERNGINEVLEKQQQEFLEKRDLFLKSKYTKKWPLDTLHTWSRVWEYPYVYYNIKNWKEQYFEKRNPKVIDVGSGVTFFPLSIAKLGCDIQCIDIDGEYGESILEATKQIPVSPGNMGFTLSDGVNLPFKNEEIDIAYSVSVLEHIPDPSHTIQEIHRVLKKNALFILTIDLDLLGNSDIGVEKYYKLVSLLEEKFEYVFPERAVHPADILYSDYGKYAFPYPHKKIQGIDKIWFFIKQWCIKPLVGKRPSSLPPELLLSVQGFVFKKR